MGVRIPTDKLSLVLTALGTLIGLVALGASPWILLVVPAFMLGQVVRLT